MTSSMARIAGASLVWNSSRTMKVKSAVSISTAAKSADTTPANVLILGGGGGGEMSDPFQDGITWCLRHVVGPLLMVMGMLLMWWSFKR